MIHFAIAILAFITHINYPLYDWKSSGYHDIIWNFFRENIIIFVFHSSYMGLSHNMYIFVCANSEKTNLSILIVVK